MGEVSRQVVLTLYTHMHAHTQTHIYILVKTYVHRLATDLLTAPFGGPGGPIFIGVQRQLSDDTWRHMDGTLFKVENSFLQWTSGEPNNWNNKENCVEVRADHRLNDRRCGVENRGACERKIINCV